MEDGLQDKDGIGRLREVHEIVKLSDQGGPLASPAEWKTTYSYDLLDNLTGPLPVTGTPVLGHQRSGPHTHGRDHSDDHEKDHHADVDAVEGFLAKIADDHPRYESDHRVESLADENRPGQAPDLTIDGSKLDGSLTVAEKAHPLGNIAPVVI